MAKHDQTRRKRYLDQQQADRERHQRVAALRKQVAERLLPLARASRSGAAIGYEDINEFRTRMLNEGMTWWSFEPGPAFPNVRLYVKGLEIRVLGVSGRKTKLASLGEDECKWLLSLIWEAEDPYSPLEQLARQT